MPLLRGPLSVTRFAVSHCPEEPDFESARFRAIAPGSELRESIGFVPMEPDADYRVGHRRFAFRVRIDRLRPDPTAVRERVMELIRSEEEVSGSSFVGAKKRRKLKQLAEEELILDATPVSKIIECCIDGNLLLVASTAKAQLGHVLTSLRKIDIVVDHLAPWIERGEAEIESDIVEARDPGESVRGCRFLRALIGDPEVVIEPEAGNVRLRTHEAQVTLTGAVLGDLHRYVERGAEVLSAKLVTADARFRFEAMSYRLSGLRVETDRHDHWTELLDERLERITTVFEQLDAKYSSLAANLN